MLGLSWWNGAGHSFGFYWNVTIQEYKPGPRLGNSLHAAIRLGPQSLFLENPCSGGSATAVASTSAVLHEKLNRGPSRIGVLIFGAVLVAGLIFIGTSISRDLGSIALGSSWPYVLLGTALLVALGFEFVNGFYDTANAVVTVIYMHSLDPISRWYGRGSGTSLAWSARPER